MTRFLALLLLAGCSRSVVAPAAVPQPSPIVVEPTAPAPSPEPMPSPDVIRPEWTGRLDVIIAGIVRNRDRYAFIERQRAGGMPWYYVAGIHERESSQNFTCHLHEGSPLTHRTFYVPKGRLITPNPPYTFEQSAEDALYVLKREDLVDWSNHQDATYAIEAYNGLGYKKYHSDVKSPYVWSGTTFYARGKYIADGRFSAITVDQQAGVEAIRLRMKQRGIL